MLVKVDKKLDKLNSLECRAPFLNKKIWNYANTLPEDYLMKGWSKKHILKEAFKKYGFSKRFEKRYCCPCWILKLIWLKVRTRKLYY